MNNSVHKVHKVCKVYKDKTVSHYERSEESIFYQF